MPLRARRKIKVALKQQYLNRPAASGGKGDRLLRKRSFEREWNKMRKIESTSRKTDQPWTNTVLYSRSCNICSQISTRTLFSSQSSWPSTRLSAQTWTKRPRGLSPDFGTAFVSRVPSAVVLTNKMRVYTYSRVTPCSSRATAPYPTSGFETHRSPSPAVHGTPSTQSQSGAPRTTPGTAQSRAWYSYTPPAPAQGPTTARRPLQTDRRSRTS